MTPWITWRVRDVDALRMPRMIPQRQETMHWTRAPGHQVARPEVITGTHYALVIVLVHPVLPLARSFAHMHAAWDGRPSRAESEIWRSRECGAVQKDTLVLVLRFQTVVSEIQLGNWSRDRLNKTCLIDVDFESVGCGSWSRLISEYATEIGTLQSFALQCSIWPKSWTLISLCSSNRVDTRFEAPFCEWFHALVRVLTINNYIIDRIQQIAMCVSKCSRESKPLSYKQIDQSSSVQDGGISSISGYVDVTSSFFKIVILLSVRTNEIWVLYHWVTEYAKAKFTIDEAKWRIHLLTRLLTYLLAQLVYFGTTSCTLNIAPIYNTRC